MAELLFVNADWSALVPAGSAEAAYGIQPKDAKRLGLLPSEGSLEEPVVLRSANVPEVKEEPKPADKAVRKPRTK